MTWGQLGFPILVGSSIAPFDHILQLLIGPRVEVDGFDATDMGTHSPMNTRAAYADEDAEIPRRPSRMLVSFTVSTDLVRLQFQEILDRLLVLGSAVWRHTPGHGCGRFFGYMR